MSKSARDPIRALRPVQTLLGAGIGRIEWLHLGDRAGIAPASAPQVWRESVQLEQTATHPDLREALNLLRDWDSKDGGSLAILSCPVAPPDLVALYLLNSIRASPRRLYLEGLTDAELNAMSAQVRRTVQRDLWISTDPIVSFASLRAAARYALHEHAAQNLTVFGQELWNQTPAVDRRLQFLDARASLLDSNIHLHWIPASLSPQ
jgi:hypothetical protein